MKARVSMQSQPPRRTPASELEGVARRASGASFADNRPAAVAQRQLAEGINAGAPQQVMRVAREALQNSPRMNAQRLLASALPASPQAAQRVEDEEPLQAKSAVAQRAEDEEQEPLQGRFGTAQRLPEPAQRVNRTGLPHPLKTGIESLSGLSMDHVEVHHNSAQHARGRLRPTVQLKDGVAINDEQGQEREADVMGARASGHLAPADLAVSGATSSIPNGSGIQRKKSQPDDNSEGAAKRFEAQSEAYAKSLANGRAKWGLLQSQLARYGSDRRDALITELNEKRAGYARTWSEHYQTKFIDKDGGVEAHTKGVKDLDSGPQTDKLPYFNKPDPESNTIEAVANYAEKDEARAAGLGLSNSEVLWRQYLDAARRQYRFNAENRAQKKVGELERLQRSQVTTPVTKQVVNLAYPDGESWNNWETKPALALTNRAWQPEQEEFKAILGTQNVLPAVWLLMDHMDELGGKTIASIETRDKEIIVAEFGPDPGAKDMEDEWERGKADIPTPLAADWEQSTVNVVPRGRKSK